MTSLSISCFKLHNALVRTIHPTTDRDRRHVTETVDMFRDMLRHNHRPGQYWDYAGNGCFKEVFFPWSYSPCVVKFVSAENNTNEEYALLKFAARRNVAQFFVPTYFIDLPVSLNAEWLEDQEDYEYDDDTGEVTFSSQELVSIQVQPTVEVYSDEQYITYNEARHTAWVAADGNQVDSEAMVVLANHIDAREWLIKAIEYYPAIELERLANFLDEFGVTDLHGANVGYDHGRPVILDCMSRSLT